LVWARQQAGLDVVEAARRVGITTDRLQAWERGESLPTVRQARLLGKAYHRPAAFFYLAQLPTIPRQLTDFRRLPSGLISTPPQLLYEIRRARFRREIAQDLLLELGETVLSFDLGASRQEDPSTVGDRLRQYFQISAQAQFGWEDNYQALHAWVGAVERRGILVFQFGGIDVQVTRGFSINERPLPVISLNAKDAPRGRIFTLLHEAGHLAISEAGLCDLHEDGGGASVEAFCNAAAAAALVPSELLLSQPEVDTHLQGLEWDDERIRALSNRFKVSSEVILRRLLTLGRVSQAFYRRKRDEYIEEYERLHSQGGGFLQYHKRVLRDNGVLYSALLLDAYHRGALTQASLSRYLGDVRLDHVDSVYHELTKR